MFESLFGAEMPLPVRFFIAFLIVLGLIGVTAWTGAPLRRGAPRSRDRARPPAAAGRDRRRRRRRASPADPDPARQCRASADDRRARPTWWSSPISCARRPRTAISPRPSRPPASSDALPRAVALGDAGTWPLQPEPAPIARPQRLPVAPRSPCNGRLEPELPPPPAPRRQSRPVDPLAGLAAEVARLPEPQRTPMPTDLGGPAGFGPREPAVPREPRAARAARPREPSSPARARCAARGRARARAARERDLSASATTDVEREAVRERQRSCREREPVREREPLRRVRSRAAASASRFGCASRRRAPGCRAGIQRQRRPEPGRHGAAAGGGVAPPGQDQRGASGRTAGDDRADTDAPPPRAAAHRPPPSAAEAGVLRARAEAGKSLYDSLEQEMASLLGRPSGKP